MPDLPVEQARLPHINCFTVPWLGLIRGVRPALHSEIVSCDELFSVDCLNASGSLRVDHVLGPSLKGGGVLSEICQG
jgi:hypothetical protein